MSFLDDLPDILADALGDEFYAAELIRTTAGTAAQNSWKPGTGPTTKTYTCRGIHDEWSVAYRDKGLVSSKDWKILILAATLEVEPRVGDKIRLSDSKGRWTTLEIVSDGEGQPAVTSDPANATWVLRCRM